MHCRNLVLFKAMLQKRIPILALEIKLNIQYLILVFNPLLHIVAKNKIPVKFLGKTFRALKSLLTILYPTALYIHKIGKAAGGGFLRDRTLG